MTCFDDNTVAELLDGRLTGAERAAADAHLDTCDACRELVGAIAGDGAPGDDGAEAPPVGAMLGRYVVVGPAGGGAMGVVVAAYDPALDRKVALKLLRAPGDDLRARILREARAMARLSHPNVVAVHDVGEEGGEVFVAMELVDGATLAAWLRRAPRTWRQICDAFVAAGRGLAAAHAAGIVHRDFKPDNVLVGSDGRARVTDFGLASLQGAPPVAPSPSPAPASAPASPSSETSTRTGALVGTPAYMAPEQHRGAPADARADVFAFCVALHEALFGERPPRDASGAAIEPAERPAGGRGVPARVRRLVWAGLATDPAARPPLEVLLAGLARDPGRTLRRAALAAGALAAVIALAAWALRPDPRAVCRGADEKLSGSWDADRRAAIAAAFRAAGAPAAWAPLEGQLEAYTRRWVALHTEACVAARVERALSETDLDLRVDCLQTRLHDLRSLTSTFLRADAQVAAEAAAAVEALPDLGTCADDATLRARISQACVFGPPAAGCRARVETLAVARVEPATALVVIAHAGAPHLLAYDGRTGGARWYTLGRTGAPVPGPALALRAGWTHLAAGERELVAYDAATGDAATLRAVPGAPAHALATARWPAGLTALAVHPAGARGDQLVLGYAAGTGLAIWSRLDAAGGLARLRDETWRTGWTTLMPYRIDGRTYNVAYDTATGDARFVELDAAAHATPIHEIRWTPGWTSFAAFSDEARGYAFYLTYKAGTGRLDLERLSPDARGELLLRTAAPPGAIQLLPFWMKGRPHVLAFRRTGELSIDRLDL